MTTEPRDPAPPPGGDALRVALVTHAFAPHTGGAELYHEIVSNALATRSRVEVFTSDRMLAEGEPARPGYPVHYLPSRLFLGERLILPWALMSALARFRPDVIWTNQPSLTGDLAFLAARTRSVPWVATYHADLDRTRVYARFYNWLEGRLLRHADTVLVNAENYSVKLQRRGVRASNLLAVAPGVAIGRGTPPAARGPGVPPGESAGPDHPLVFVGGLDTARMYKHPDQLLAAIASLQASGRVVSLDLIGDGDRRAALEKLSQDWNLTGSVRFRGQLDDQELADRYRSAWALVLPSSDSEGYGLVAIEAVFYGCPVVCSDGPAASVLLEREGCGITFPAGDTRALAEAIWGIWADPPLRQRLSEAADRLRPRLSWKAALPTICAPILRAAALHRAGSLVKA
jgi:phosphatidylinositol alpha-mannosyltransferase